MVSKVPKRLRMAATALLVCVLGSCRQGPAPAPRPEPVSTVLASGRIPAVMLARDGRSLAWLECARQATEGRAGGEACTLRLVRGDPAHPVTPGRSATFNPASLSLRTDGTAAILDGGEVALLDQSGKRLLGGPAVELTWTRSGRRLAVLKEKDRTLELVTIDGQQPAGTVTVGRGVARFALDSGGDRVAWLDGQGALRVWSAEAGSSLVSEGVGAFALAEGSGAIAYLIAADGGTLRLWQGGSATRRLVAGVTRFDLSSDGTLVAFARADAALRVLQAGPRGVWTEQGVEGGVSSFAFAPGTGRLFYLKDRSRSAWEWGGTLMRWELDAKGSVHSPKVGGLVRSYRVDPAAGTPVMEGRWIGEEVALGAEGWGCRIPMRGLEAREYGLVRAPLPHLFYLAGTALESTLTVVDLSSAACRMGLD